MRAGDAHPIFQHVADVGPSGFKGFCQTPVGLYEVEEVLVRKAEEQGLERRGKREIVVLVPEKEENVYERLDLVFFVKTDAADHAIGDAFGLERRLVFLEPRARLDEDGAVAVFGGARLPAIF